MATSGLFVNLVNGNVGIGTTLPKAALDIVGNVNINGYSTNENVYPPQAFTNATTTGNGGSTTTLNVNGQSYGNGTYIASDNGVASLAYSVNGAWAAFDLNTTTFYWSYNNYVDSGFTGGNTHYVQLQMPRKIKLTKYTVYAPVSNNNPKDWILEASVDGTTFVTLNSVVGETWSSAATKEYLVNSQTGFSYFRFRVLRVANALSVNIYEIKYYGYEEYSIVTDTNGNVGIGTTLPKAALSVVGDMSMTGNISAGNLGMFRNRVMNGDMRIDQRNAGTGVAGLTGSYLTYKTQPANFYTVDRFAVAAPSIGALTAKQVSLGTSDVVALGGGFTNAVELGLAPKDGLAVYLPFDSNITDASGNGVTMTPTGTMRYVDACVVGSNALYLANEANVTAGTAASNRLSAAYTYPTYWTVSFWACAISLGSYNRHLFSSASSVTGSLAIYLTAANQCVATVWGTGNIGSSVSLGSEKVWFHVAVSCTNRTFAFYVNGTQSGSTNTYAYTGGQISFGLTDTQSAFAGFIDDFRLYNRALSASEIAALATNVGIPVAPASSLASGLTTRLTFDNVTTDAQGTLPAPTVTGTASYSPVSKVGTASLDLTANSAGGLTTSTATTALTYTLASGNFTVPLTLAGWFNAGTVSFIQVPFVIGNNTGVGNWATQIYIDSTSKVFWNVYVGATNYAFATPFTITAGTWYHGVLTAASSSYMNCYLNGVLVGSVAVPSGTLNMNTGTGTPNQLRIGAQTGTNIGYNFKGLIDDVRIYNRVLSSREVAGLYASSQYAAYSLFQQTIEGNNLSDLGWGTALAQPVTASLWIKNRTASNQQFSISANNTGMLAWIDFEGGSYADKLGFLTNAKLTGSGSITTTSGNYKVGSAAFDLTTNTAGAAPTTVLDYSVPNAIQLPITISFWFKAITVNPSADQRIIGLGSGAFVGVSNWSTQFSIQGPSGQAYAYLHINGNFYQLGPSTATAVTAGVWWHVCYILAPSTSTLYLNGIAITTASIPNSAVITNYLGTTNTTISQLRIGTEVNNNTGSAFKGYIDDVRIYNRALSATQIYQLYANNATSTTPSNYLIPRSLIYNTPVIPANTWQKVSVTIPGDTTGQWMTNTDAGLTLSLCMGASGLYNTNTLGSWLDAPDYMGSNVQLYGDSDSAFLSSITNSIYVTGWQLEKGTMVTPFEFRPLGIELQLCQRYAEVLTYLTNNSYTADNYSRAYWFYKTTKRNIPILIETASSSFANREIGLDHLIVYTAGASSSLTSGSIANSEF